MRQKDRRKESAVEPRALAEAGHVVQTTPANDANVCLLQLRSRKDGNGLRNTDYTGQIPEISLGSIADRALQIADFSPKCCTKNGVSICNLKSAFVKSISSQVRRQKNLPLPASSSHHRCSH